MSVSVSLPEIQILSRCLLGTAWVSAGFLKLRSETPVSEAIARFDLLSERSSRRAGAVLPYFELAIGSFILLGVTIRVAAVASLLLLLLFTWAIAFNLVRGRSFECNCFGGLGPSRIGPASLIRNLLLATLSLPLVWFPSDFLSLSGWIRGSTAGPGNPSSIVIVPAILLTAGLFLAAVLLSESIRIARAMAHAEDGPHLGTPEHRLLRAWMRPD
jgi:putative oxidoreductase